MTEVSAVRRNPRPIPRGWDWDLPVRRRRGFTQNRDHLFSTPGLIVLLKDVIARVMRAPEVPAPSIFPAQSGHRSNRTRDSFLGHPEEMLLVFQVADEHAGFDPNEWFSVQSTHDGRDVQIVQLRKFPRPQFVVAVLSGSVMSGAQRDRG